MKSNENKNNIETKNNLNRTLVFEKLSESDYDTFQKDHKYGNFLNSIKALRLKEKRGWKVDYYGVRDTRNGQLLSALSLSSIPIMKLYRYVVSERGFLIDYSESNLQVFNFLITELKQHLKKINCLYYHINPYVPYQEHDKDGNIVEDGFNNQKIVNLLKNVGFIHRGFTTENSQTYQSRWMFVLSLKDKTKDDILANMHQQTRWSINKTIREGISIREINIDEIEVFNQIMEHTSHRRNFHNNGSDYYRLFLETYGDSAKLLLAYLDVEKHVEKIQLEKNSALQELEVAETKLVQTPNNKKLKNRINALKESISVNDRKIDKANKLKETNGNEIPLAASIFIMSNNEVTYLFSGAYDEYKSYNAPYALQWYMIQYALDHGYERYNFYGTSGNFNKDAEDYGVYEFKKGFDGQVEELIGDFFLPIKKNVFKIYKRIKPNQF